ncbi:Hypothetical predicted protein [Mytilus galloprovincialis]|uniref:Uncharacterized protein n=2 Tax=Mytilus galloprovincialis TaxID=29158 RepID=A0A8B6H602_MYTGA|nr:Hypothetical predicted protein [Mytilus galloprovincialis]
MKMATTETDETYIKTMKMAIAMACIRSKPEGLTAKEYTEQLCQNYLQKQQECQDKLKSAENEILQLRQQLVLQSTLGQNAFLPLRNTVQAEEPQCLTPPSSGTTTCTVQSTTDNSKLIQNTAFLQSILNLQSITRTPQLTSVTYTTLKNSLTMVKYCIENEANIPLSSIQKNVHVIMGVLDSEKIVDLVQVVDCIIDIVMCILNMLLFKEHESMEEAECLVTLVTSFCHVKLFERIVKMTLTVIEEFSNHLRNVQQKKEEIDLLKYWNLYNVFKILENIFHKHREHSLMMSSDFVDMINERLDETLLHLTDPFPLFAHAVWKIQGILNQIVSESQQ